MKKIAVIAIGLVCCTALPALAQRAGAPAGPANPFGHDAQAVAQGEAVYDKSCTGCHGPNGGAGEIGPALVNSTGPDSRRSDGQFFGSIKNGISGTPMPAFGGKLADDDIWRVVSYIQALRGTAIDSPTPGDAANGEAIFWGKGGCGGCHMLKGKGSLMGPDLSNIAGTRKSAAIIDALTKPFHHIYGSGGAHILALPPMDTYLPVHVTTKGGKTVDGVLMNQDGYSMQIMGNDEQLHLFDRAQLSKIVIEPKSKMPTDYDKRLTADEFKDLLAFLTRQGVSPPPAAGRAPASD
jgi:cytochrome c oxidase cbb3-type subunit 3